MPKIVYNVKNGYVCNGDIQAIGKRIAEIQRRNADERYTDGRNSYDELIKDGQRKDSPLYPCFTHEIAAAAHKCWTTEARYLLNSYSYKIISDSEEEIAYGIANVRVVDPVTKDRYSVPSPFAAREPDFRCQIIDEANRFLNGAVNRLKILEGMEPKAAVQAAAIEKIIKENEKIKAKKKPAKAGK
jgi:hypothetical protein